MSFEFGGDDIVDLREEYARLCAEHDGFERPRVRERAGLSEWNQTIKLAHEWDAANPEKAARREWIVERIDAINAALKKLATERMHSTSGVAAIAVLETTAVLALREWLRSEHQWCTIVGPTGTGKTVALKGVLTRYNQMVVRAVDLVRNVYENPREREQMLRCAVLAVDDVGAEGDGEGARRALYDVLDSRHEERRRTIITSNLSGEALVAHLGVRLVDRIRHNNIPIRLEGKSLRASEKKKP
jgi:DNA replication protein DnaC